MFDWCMIMKKEARKKQRTALREKETKARGQAGRGLRTRKRESSETLRTKKQTQRERRKKKAVHKLKESGQEAI